MTRNAFTAVLLFILDILITVGAVFLAKFIQRLLPEVCLPDDFLWVKAVIYSGVCVGCFYFQDLYNWRYWRRSSELTSSILLGGGVTLIVLALLYYILPVIGLERDVLLIALAITLGSSFIIRLAYLKLKFADGSGSRVIILGDGENAKFLFQQIRSGGHPVIFEGYIGRNNWDIPSRCLGDVHDLSKIIQDVDPDVLVVAPDGWRGTLPIDDLLHVKLAFCDVIDAPTFYEDVTGKILVEEIRPSSIIFTRGFMSSPLQDALKRGFDVFFALIGLVVSAPIMFITAIIIRLESPGPIFYLQQRVGKDGKNFKVIKFRSMRQDAEQAGPQWASENDPRVTRVGRIIRKIRIDELPQFINVIKNDMSFVGPRPERRYFVDQLEKVIPFYALRMHAKPGITGWAQINYPYGDTIEDAKEKLKYELYYMKHRSLWLDLVIIFQTVKVAIKARGAQ
ncbi:MAG TPA: TIGR03013 family PEP-CTERM/XrtA system glycosyltransferase [Deltaproteobacteria bacterium]|nr:TIGR03013 family PEP-CTERM/XrtA system glycosyltransferase [Deltaproteobacteria bacterium]HPJ92525.1 TIGR03013 family PEP-CTERM/XrtA system glycosyltransferase [Deltaproteobacteria bacterium]HPR50789.1 TIGR03013 family PEP-CTERM/XrtA system glycosyltransferase [Deltaproteobacteria bacterium]